MSIVSEINRCLTASIHPDVADGTPESARHGWFISSKFALSVCATIVAPLMSGPPYVLTAFLVLCLALAMVPAFTAVYVARTGRISGSQVTCFLSMLALTNILSFNGQIPLAATVVWLAILSAEALLTAEARWTRGIVALSVASIVFAIVRSMFGIAGASIERAVVGEVMILTCGMIYLAAVVLCGLRLSMLRNSAARDLMINFDALSETAGDFIARFDRGGTIIIASEQSETLFGVAASSLRGRGFFDRVLVADRPAFLKGLNDASALNTDVSKLVLHDEELEQARTTAERANALKDRFLANVSHELRTPLNAIIGFSEMLGSLQLQPKDPAKIKEYADIIHSSGEHLLSVVNTILDMSKMEAGSFSIDPEPFEFAQLIDSCCDMVRLKAGQGNIRITRDIVPGLGEIVADKRACKQILLNLLSNGVKFTPPGGEVNIQLRPEGNSLRVNVSDTGIGIATGDMAKLGNPFFQAKATHDRAYEGTGLGLSVVRGLVGLHGGTIGVESAPGQGTRVSIRLPLDCRSVTTSPSGGAKIETIVRYAHSTGEIAPGHPGQEATQELVKRRA